MKHPAAPSPFSSPPGPLPAAGAAERRRGWRQSVLASLGVLVAAIFALRALGRTWWCACGAPRWWVGDIWSEHNSQHLLDPYSFSHVQHGILFYAAVVWLAPKCPAWWRAALAITVEAAWEVLENTAWVIEKYRDSTVSLEYFGDSVVNSVGDVAACAAGYALAARLPVWSAAAICAAIEIAMLFWIRDSLLLNVLMLAYPFETIKTWQMGG